MQLHKTTALHLFVFALIISSAALPALAADVTLAWDANTEPDLAGYKVYFGTASRNYESQITIGSSTTYTITGLGPGTYYFAVTARNGAGQESAYSNEVTATVGSSSCDMNADSSVNALDLQALINVILGIRTCPGTCDINRDTRVDVLDLQVLSNVVLGIRTCP
jgi:hypothetical protein